MPTPYGSRGGMAFSADELRVLRRALAIAVHPHSVPTSPSPERDEEVRDCLALAQAVDEAAREGGRLRSFLLADLARYRAALPGSVTGYVERLGDALAAGYQPGPDDLAALRALCAAPAGDAEAVRRRVLLRRCEHLAELAVRSRLARHGADGRTAARRRLHAVPGGRTAVPGSRPGEGPEQLPAVRASAGPEPKPGPRPGPKPGKEPAKEPAAPPSGPRPPRPDRPIPTPGEVFPPRRKPAPPPAAAKDPQARPA
ncbi:hypothetical protein ACFP1Z_26550 [Streptomyces gamaensis]|uniref:Uncharacterized protein n=1 Tax=Streptomyces gamaensis TaxID=1763542 RepID=A0ABW0ZAX0_9ACTN